tara:strand:+ start:15629 stop:16429 length:801 start_codon:yes stop_codon:yes gene_type:complete
MSKTILITGSTDGIGKLTAIKLAKEGHKIYVHGRNEVKLAKAVQEVKEESNNDEIYSFIADFSDLSAVQKMARQVKDQVRALDILINNAGVYNSPQLQNKDGIDMRMVVNYLAPYVLTNALLPTLKKGTDIRVINLSSAAQMSVSEEVLKGVQTATEQQTYAQSKLALLMWSFYLAEKEPDIQVIAVNPGSLLNTKMVKEAFGHHYSSVDKGANILYDLAVSYAYKGITEQYFDNDRGAFGNAHQDAYDQHKIERLISVTNEILNH